MVVVALETKTEAAAAAAAEGDPVRSSLTALSDTLVFPAAALLLLFFLFDLPVGIVVVEVVVVVVVVVLACVPLVLAPDCCCCCCGFFLTFFVFGKLLSFLNFIRLFWNQILIWRSVSFKLNAISIRRRRVKYLLVWNSFSSSMI